MQYMLPKLTNLIRRYYIIVLNKVNELCKYTYLGQYFYRAEGACFQDNLFRNVSKIILMKYQDTHLIITSVINIMN